MSLQNLSWCSSEGLLSRNTLLLLSSSSSGRRRKAERLAVCSSTFVCLTVGISEIAEIANNKVLIAASLSAAIGQLSKPFTSAIRYGNKNKFNPRAVFQAGGFPSTHSSAVVATATSLGLERGFSDVIFGLSVVYAALVMYDAQGVRREVGAQAKTLNRLFKTQLNPISGADLLESQTKTSSLNAESLDPLVLEEASYNLSQGSKPTETSLLPSSPGKRISSSLAAAADVDDERSEKLPISDTATLNESVGHTLTEVVAGALLGLFVSLALYTT